jgi:uncharacterized protein (TIGR00369 family)
MTRFDMPFMRSLGVRIIRAGAGRAELSLEVRPEHLNAFGNAHGGLVAALIDVAVGAAAAIGNDTLRPNLTLALTTQYLRPAPAVGMLVAYAQVRGGGAQVAFVDATVSADGEPIAIGTATLQYVSV